MIKTKLQKTDIKFDKEIEEIIRARFGCGLDKRLIGRAIVQRKLIKLPEWGTTKNKLKSLRFIDEKN